MIESASNGFWQDTHGKHDAESDDFYTNNYSWRDGSAEQINLKKQDSSLSTIYSNKIPSLPSEVSPASGVQET